MPETTEFLEGTSSQAEAPDPTTVRDALLRLRQIASGLPTVDAAAVIRDIREAGTRTI
ncbi:MAG: hypothetical protein AABO41_28475 [Acidobacteriota bacterium]